MLSPERPLEPSPAEMRAMGEAVLGFLEEFVARLPDAPANVPAGAAELVERLRESAPEHGSAFAPLLDLIAAGTAAAVEYAGPGHMAYIPGGGLWAAAVADFVAAAVNRYVALWSLAPAMTQIEWTAVRWLCDLFDYPDESRGVLTSGGSMANFSALVTARHVLLSEDFVDGVVYVTDQTHASVAKAAYLAGLPRRGVRLVRTTDDLGMDVAALARQVAEDRRAGLRPFCVVASAGTTNTGAIDPLGEVADVAQRERLWLHVDGAYGGTFQLTERGRARLAGIERADSITLDPSKGMFLPYGTGALLVEDGAQLRAAHHVGAEYLQDIAAEEHIPNFSEYSPELSRNFRGLRLWLPIKLHGLAAFRGALDEKLDLARHLYDELRATPGFELPWEPQLTTVAFRYRPRNGDNDLFNARLLERINGSQRIVLSSTMLRGQFVIRACILSHRTHRDRVEEAVHIIRTAARELDRP